MGIDKAIEKKSLWNCCLLLTSRETEEVSKIKDYLDAEFEIEGFDRKNIKRYITRTMADDYSKSNQLLAEAATKGLFLPDGKGGYNVGFLMIPLLLNMICSLFLSKMTLPRTKTGILDSVVNKIIDREAIRAKGQKALATANTALLQIGKLAWQGLTSGKFIFQKVTVNLMCTFGNLKGVKRSRIHYCPFIHPCKIPIENLKPTSILMYIDFYNI